MASLGRRVEVMGSFPICWSQQNDGGWSTASQPTDEDATGEVQSRGASVSYLLAENPHRGSGLCSQLVSPLLPCGPSPLPDRVGPEPVMDHEPTQSRDRETDGIPSPPAALPLPDRVAPKPVTGHEPTQSRDGDEAISRQTTQTPEHRFADRLFGAPVPALWEFGSTDRMLGA